MAEYRKLMRKGPGIDSTLLQTNQSRKQTKNQEDYHLNHSGKLVSSFSTASTVMSSDKLMNTFINNQINASKVSTSENKSKVQQEETELDKLRAGLFEIPENLRVRIQQVQEDDLNKSASVMAMITEVDLGIKNKVINIEETEKAILARQKHIKREQTNFQCKSNSFICHSY